MQTITNFNDEPTLGRKISSGSAEKPKRDSVGKDIFSIMQSNYLANDKPRRLGNMYCFWYRKKQPMIVIGPDYFWSIM